MRHLNPKNYPDLIREWDYNKNSEKPELYTKGSRYKAHWICKKCNHEWKATISNRSNGTGCPACSGRVVTNTNNLKVTHPEFAKEWNYDKNKNSPEQYTKGSHYQANWLCKYCSNDWKCPINDRKILGCPECSRIIKIKMNNIAITHPDLIKEWNNEKNKFKAKSYTYGSTHRVFWICKKCNHEWKSKIRDRVLGAGCPECRKLISIEKNNLANKYPDLIKDWDFKKNEKSPSEYSYGSKYKAHWICHTCDYNWQATINNRSNGTGCPACSGRILTESNNLTIIRPDLVKDWDFKKNEKSPSEFSYGSKYKAHWICHKCRYNWKATINARKDSKCPNCSRKKEKSTENLEQSNPELIEEWDFSKNINPPSHFTKGMKNKAHWICKKCNHEWQSSIYHRSTRSQGCPACSGRVATGKNNLSVTNPELIEEWDNIKNSKDSDQYKKSSAYKAYWICKECNYEWQARIYNRTKGIGCPACSGRNATDRDNFKIKNPKIAKEWNYHKNKSHPEKYRTKSNYKANWVCEKCNFEWKATIADRTREYGCPSCSGRIATELNNLTISNPELLEEWDKNRNEYLPNSFTKGSDYKAYWICKSCLYNWNATISSRTIGVGCPACSGRVVTDSNNLTITHPKLLEEWDFKNNEKLPNQFTKGAKYKAHWICKVCKLTWQAQLSHRTNGIGCPACSGRVVTESNNLTVIRPDLIKDWNYRKNNSAPDKYTRSSSYNAYWICNHCSTEWKTTINNRTSHGTGCPTCNDTTTNQKWRFWEKLCAKILLILSPSSAQFQPRTRLPNNSLPDMSYRN
ncbi:MAG: hydrogenase nickel incorporation protein HypA, partial [Candidatus Heimdallarchaeota archaeon LC_3]